MAMTPAAFIPKPDVCQPSGSAELPMLDVYMPMMKSAAILSAGQLGLFEALAEGPLAPADLAGKLAASPDGIATLADFLVTLGYLEKQGDRYANGASTQRWFTRAGQVDYTPGLLWTQEAWPMMGELSQAVRRGGPATTLWESMVETPRLGQVFAAYMAAFAGDLGPDLIAHVPVAPDYRRLLDIGGSHGLHSIRFCRQYPQLNAEIVDLPSALTDTGARLVQHQLADRIRLNPGNLLTHDWGGDFDLVFYLSVAHNQTADDNARVIRRIADSLRPGGLLVIHEYIEGMPINAFHAAFRLTLLYETGTRIHRQQDYSAWLSAAGFSAITRIDLNPLEKGSLILARR
jgi:SAM-dependent methyltransferase